MPMKITIRRILELEDQTVSQILIDGESFCFALENGKTGNKLKAGLYSVGIRQYGRINDLYERIFPMNHRGMIEVLNDKSEESFIYMGNTKTKLKGGIIPCTGVSLLGNINATGVKARAAYCSLYNKIAFPVARNEVKIEIIDNGIKAN